MFAFKIKLLDLFLFFTFLACCCCFMPISPIYRNLPVCRETNNSIDLDLPCEDNQCVIYKNLVYQMSSQDDMFNYIFTADFKQIIVYSNKGRVYHTECDTISSFDLTQTQNCSKYVGVSNFKFKTFNHKIGQTFGYLTKQMIIRLTINTQEPCDLSTEVEEFGNYDKEFKVFKKGNKVTITGRNDTNQAIDFDVQNAFLDAYDNLFDSTLPKLLKDFFISIIGVLVYIAIVYKFVIKSKKSCSKFSKNKRIGPKNSVVFGSKEKLYFQP